MFLYLVKEQILKILYLNQEIASFPITISLVISNNKKANGLKYAKKYKIPNIYISTNNRLYENKVLSNLKKYNITFICLAGYMKIISNKLIKKYQKKIINIHPFSFAKI